VHLTPEFILSDPPHAEPPCQAVDHQLQQGGGLHCTAQPASGLGPCMFGKILQLAAIEHQKTAGGAAGAAAACVDDLRPGYVSYFPACIDSAAAQIDLFAEHEKIFVQQSHLIKDRPASHQAGAVH